jgi:hypothetical protein
MMSAERSFGVLLVSMSEYRIDGVFRYTGDELPRTGDLITVVDDQAGRTREARVRRVSPEDALAIHATDMTAIPPERWVAPRERVRRGTYARSLGGHPPRERALSEELVLAAEDCRHRLVAEDVHDRLG